ncbi:MAG TPA: hypothetical protein VIV55_11030 [Flavobacterium sp.]
MNFQILNNFKYSKRGNSKGIIILDDILPSPLSPWRSYEYSEICKSFNNTRILTDVTTFKNYSQGKTFEENLKILTENYPSLKNNINKLKFGSNLNSELIYMLFYNNIKKYFKILDRNKNPFAFTLYPGGGFGFDDNSIDENLKTIFNSKHFRGVTVNQYITKKYLIDKQLCDPELINLIPGVPLNLSNPKIQNFEYLKDSEKTSILFFANKYTPDGSDKGFDVFQKIACALAHKKNQFNFIVIGDFSEKNITEESIKNTLIFKGVLTEFEFETVLKESHILISANKPFILSKNAFDGFPLATCVTASLFGNVNFMTDYFNESDYLNLKDGQDFIKINTDLNPIIQKILELHLDRDLMKKIAENGRTKMLHLYSFENQITPRIEHFKKILL